jgi:hypothetical protein
MMSGWLRYLKWLGISSGRGSQDLLVAEKTTAQSGYEISGCGGGDDGGAAAVP